MIEERKIPVVVGVTGHRQIREQDRAAITQAVRSELRKLKELCPHSPLLMLNSLAEGADLLCADVAEELGIPVIGVLPAERDIYEKDFSAQSLSRFCRHCQRAEDVFTAPPTELFPEGGSQRNYRFRQAGIYVSSHCHVLLALWDGGPGSMARCGTADAVDFALHGSYAPTAGISLRADSNEAVIHIFTPRGERTGEAAGAVHILGNREAVLDVLRKTDDFNREVETLDVIRGSRMPIPVPEDSVLVHMESIGVLAGKLSQRYARQYRLILSLLAVASALLTFAFLMYDEAQAIWMILICGLMLLGAWCCMRLAARSDCHRRYIEYRVLAECLRVQTYLRYAGSDILTQELLSWTQQEETAWIMDALCALTVGRPPVETHDICDCWVLDQKEYHEVAGKRALTDLSRSEKVVQIALFVSILLYLAAVFFEILSGGLLFPAVLPIADAELYRTLLKISLGTISAVTLFISNYYGRLSLPRSLSDHQKMARFYGKMAVQLKARGQTRELLTVLAREELVENGNWCSYQRDNKPDLSI